MLLVKRSNIGFNISANLQRWHLNESQKVLVAAQLANMPLEIIINGIVSSNF